MITINTMMFHDLDQTLILIFALLITVPISTSLSNNFQAVAKPNCVDSCGDITIPFPFGTTQDCYLNYSFFVACDGTFKPPKLFMQNTSIEITDISLDGQLKLMQPVTRECYAPDGRRLFFDPWILVFRYMTVNNTANKFTIVGCDTHGFISGWKHDGRNFTTGCTAMCNAKDDMVEGSCQGIGCCQTFIPGNVWSFRIDLSSYNNYSNVWDFNNCGYAFFVEEAAFSFSADNFTTLRKVQKLPMVVDWAFGNGTNCVEATSSSDYICKSVNSECYYPGNGYGYRCRCRHGYQGNPYLVGGCQDIDECKVPGPSKCEYKCENTEGGFDCPCPKGYKGDGKVDGKGCRRGESPIMLRLVAGISLGVIALLLATCWLYLELKRRKLNKNKKTFFLQNGGILLQQKLNRKETSSSSDTAKIFSSSELHKATNNFHNNMIIGQGGYGTVYKGYLPDNRIVAIKKSKKVDPTQIDQFVNEVIVLSQINHRNVVKLLGCCLETEVPLLVYEFISNGTLSAHLHSHNTKARFLNWETRLRIAADTAGVLSYLHSSASIPIIHRDVKTDNILLDHNFTAKVSDFGASKLVPLDHTQLSTMVQGTFGYLDPEYMQTNQLTEKSDVYSFGVVLLQLLTGRRAISFDKPENEKNLANYFLYVLKQERLLYIVDDNIVDEGNNYKQQMIEVGMIAQGCLHVRGEDRPTMKEVAMELERLIHGGKHGWARNEHDSEEMEFLLGDQKMDGFGNGDGNSINVGYDSLRDHDILPMNGGR